MSGSWTSGSRCRMTPRRSRSRRASASTPTGRGRPKAGSHRRTRSSCARSGSGCARRRPGARWRCRPTASRPGMSASPTRPTACARTCACPARAHLWMLFVRPPWWGTGLAARLHGARPRGGRAPGLRDDPPLHALRRRPRPRLLRARGLGARLARVLGAAARPGPGRVPSRAVIPDRFFEDAAERSRVSMATRWHRVHTSWRTMVQAGHRGEAAWAVAKWLLGHPSPVLRPGRRRDRARDLLPRARPAGGRARGRRHARDRAPPTCSPTSSARASPSWACGLHRDRHRHVLRDQPAVRQPGRGLGGARVHGLDRGPAASRSRARWTRSSAARSRSRSPP